VALTPLSSGCYAPQLALLRSGLDSLRTQVDTLNVRDEIAYRALEDARRQIAEQKDILLSTRATTGSTTQQMYEQMEKLNTRLDEVLNRFNQVSQRINTPPPAAGAAPSGDPNQLYDQASQDLTQGRYTLALQGFRDYVQRFPNSDLADNAQYGIGECFFAQAKFDSASTEYGLVEARFPQGDKVPASLWKRALCAEKLNHNDDAHKILQDLVKRYPQSGEAQLAREKLGPARRR
jgi:tol-pal system protein YbgF